MKLTDDRDWLLLSYVDQGRSAHDTARQTGCDPSAVYARLKRYGIKTRGRGQNLSRSGKDNYTKTPGAVNPFLGKTHSERTRTVLSDKASKPKPYLMGKGNGMYGAVGPLNPNYKDGSSPHRQSIYSSAEWKEILRNVYKRDGYRCQRCGTGKKGPRSLHAHHIKPWAGNPDSRTDQNNLVTLCKDCHEWVHSSANSTGEFLT